MQGVTPGVVRYLIGAAVLLLVYAVVAPVLWAGRGFDPSGAGPLTLEQRDAEAPPEGAELDLDEARIACSATDTVTAGLDAADTVRIVGGVVDRRPLYACYQMFDSGGVNVGGVVDAVTGLAVRDAQVLKDAGVWRWVAAVKTPGEVVAGGVASAAILSMYLAYYRRPRPGPGERDWRSTRGLEGMMVAVPLVGWAAILTPGRSTARRLRLAYLVAMYVLWFCMVIVWFEVERFPDALGLGIVGLVTVAGLYGWLAGRGMVAPPAFGLPDGDPRAEAWRRLPPRPSAAGTPPAELDGRAVGGAAPSAGSPRPGRDVWDADAPTDAASADQVWGEPGDRPPPWDAPAGDVPAGDALTPSPPPVTPPPGGGTGGASGASPPSPPAAPDRGDDRAPRPRSAPQPAAGDDRFEVAAPGDLPTFRDVGGMDEVKRKLHDSVGLLLAFSTEADAFRITYNGILLHGPPGTGKTFLAQATAGEHGLRYLRVDVSDIVSKWVGESAQNIRAAFEAAASELPCLLFFDEFDSVAARRDDEASSEARRTVNQLLQSLEAWRDVRELVVVAATNHLDRLDPAAIRPGRFDKHVRIDLPDRAARLAVLEAQLRDRPCADDLDLGAVADRTEGMTPAAIAATVQAAALAAFRETTLDGQLREVTVDHLLGALRGRGGQDRPGIEGWSWDRLILAPDTLAELRQLQLLLEDPERARGFGIDPPSGALLTGPPGTGKTTIARTLAAEAEVSFYPATVSDLTSKWVGESEEKVARLFARARDNAPSIIFLDEIDAVAARRGSSNYGDRLVNQLLAEMDGMGSSGRVFVLAATNRPELLDPALTRGGRLSRSIEIPLPDLAQRRGLLELFTRRMPLVDVPLDDLAVTTDGWSGADLEALCQQAAIEAMIRGTGDDPAVTFADLELARAAVAATDRPDEGAVRRSAPPSPYL